MSKSPRRVQLSLIGVLLLVKRAWIGVDQRPWGALSVDRRPILFRSRPWGARTGGPHPDVLPATPSRPSGHLYRHTQARTHTYTHLCVIIGSISSHSRVSAGPLTSINHSPPLSAVLKPPFNPHGHTSLSLILRVLFRLSRLVHLTYDLTP